ncbi:MAG: (2Fe-2S)-binding protein [Candidatus Eisenbacteria bacterium]
MKVRFRINGKGTDLDVTGRERLIDLLRERLNLVGTKEGCGKGECGACTVLLDGEPACACLLLSSQIDGAEILTIEGVACGGELHPVQDAFMETGAVQCGFCTPGTIMSSVALLTRNPRPSEENIRSALSGNLCRCTGYTKIVDAVKLASRRMRTDGSHGMRRAVPGARRARWGSDRS